jgi:hypothetical protein
MYIDYGLSDSESDPCSIVAQYSTDDSTWHTPTQYVFGDGTSCLSSAPTGIYHLFYWDTVADLGYTLNSHVWFQITPSDVGGTGYALSTNQFTVDNRAVLPPPTTTAPGNSSPPGPMLSDTQPTFYWASVAGAASYNFYYTNLTTNSSLEVGFSAGTTSYKFDSWFWTAGDSYCWWVTTVNSAGAEGTHSPYLYFRTPATVIWTGAGSGN